MLELFKNTLPSGLYWVLFSINNLTDAVDAAKRVLTKEKIDRQLSGQTGTATSFMKVRDVHHSNNMTVSFSTQDPIREQLVSVTSNVYNMYIQKEGITDHLSPRYIKREKEAKSNKSLRTETEIDHSVGRE